MKLKLKADRRNPWPSAGELWSLYRWRLRKRPLLDSHRIKKCTNLVKQGSLLGSCDSSIVWFGQSDFYSLAFCEHSCSNLDGSWGLEVQSSAPSLTLNTTLRQWKKVTATHTIRFGHKWHFYVDFSLGKSMMISLKWRKTDNAFQ